MSLPTEHRRSKTIFSRGQLPDSLPLKSFELKDLNKKFEQWKLITENTRQFYTGNSSDHVIITKCMNDDLNCRAKKNLVENAEKIRMAYLKAKDKDTNFKYCGSHIQPVELISSCFAGFKIGRRNVLKLEAEYNKAINLLRREKKFFDILEGDDFLDNSQILILNFTIVI